MTDHAPLPAPYRIQASQVSDVSLGGVPVEAIITTPPCPQSLPMGLRLTPLDISPGSSEHHHHHHHHHHRIAGELDGVERTGRLLGVGEHLEGSVASRAGSDPSGSGSQLVASRSASLMPSQSTPRKKPHLQGRFSGRLETKEDEKKLHDECKLLGPLVGGVGKRGEKNRMTLAKIVRAISSGDVRKHCEERENRIHEVEERMKALEVYYQREIALLKQENANYRLKLETRGGEEMNVRQAASAHYSPEPIGTYGHNITGVDVSSLPFLLPAQNPSAAVIQGPVSGGAVHTFPLQQPHAHLAVPSMPHHTMVGGMQSNILRDQIHSAKPLLAEELQARSQMVHQVRQSTIGDGSLKRKRDEFNKVAQAAEGMIGLKPAGLDEDTIVADGVSPVPKEEASEPPTKTYHLAEHPKIASSHVLKAHSIQSQNSSDNKPAGSSPFSVGRTSCPTSNPQQALLANGNDKGSAQGLSYSSEHVASSLSFQNQKMSCRVDSGPYHSPLHHRNYPTGNGMGQQWLRQAPSLGNQYFMGEQERYYQHMSKESLQQHNSMVINHPQSGQLVATPSAHNPAASMALASDVTQSNGDPSVADHRNTAEMDMGHGVSSLLHQGVRSVSGGHAAMVSSQTGVNTEVGHQI